VNVRKYNCKERQWKFLKSIENFCKPVTAVDEQKCKSVPLQALSGPEGSRKLMFPDYMKTAQDGGKVVSLTHRPPLPPGNAPGTHFYQRLSQLQGHSAIGRILSQWKVPVTPAGIKPATFRFVAQHLNHCATAVPYSSICFYLYSTAYRLLALSSSESHEGKV